MCGDDAVDRIRQNWMKYLPKILELNGKTIQFWEDAEEETMYQAIKTLDSSFRSPGVGSKSHGAIQFCEVS